MATAKTKRKQKNPLQRREGGRGAAVIFNEIKIKRFVTHTAQKRIKLPKGLKMV